MMRHRTAIAALVAAGALGGCALDEPEGDGRNQQVEYRTGTNENPNVDDPIDYTSNGERGNVSVTEVLWSGSVEGTMEARVHHPDDIFIELQNKHPRPVHLTGWLLTVRTGANLDTYEPYVSHGDRAHVTYVLPARENGQPIEPNGYVIIAARRDGAFRDADYYIEDLRLPEGPFEISLQDLDERLMDHALDYRKPIFAGGFDLVTSRSMERTQLIFGNRGNRDSSWHAYSLNAWDAAGEDSLHVSLRRRIHEDFRALTYATPGRPNSPDYSGNVSSGSFE